MPKGKANTSESYSRQLAGLNQHFSPQEIERRADAWPAKPPQPKPRTLFSVEIEGTTVYVALTSKKRHPLFRLVTDPHGQLYARVGSHKKILIPKP